MLIERADRAGFWQSVTGSLDAPDEDLALAAAREVFEETGISVKQLPANALRNMHQQIEYEIYPEWRFRYAPGVTRNIEHWFALEVPEITDRIVEIMAVAREAGHRTKIAVRTHRAGVSPKGSLIGPVGSRARAVMDELHGEKIDIVDWSEDPAVFVAHALAPAKVSRVEVTDLLSRSAKVTVPDYQLSLAIGKDGQNARLAARLTGWRIDIHPDTPATE